VIIRVENNGNQINWEKVVEAALGRGIIDKGSRDRYLKDINGAMSEIEKLIYNEQLSTKEKVTETSGRGVGLAIVKSVIEALGGAVSIESPTKDGGVAFVLSLPLTLAIIQALLVRSSNQIFALPFSQIDRSVRVPFKNIKKAFDQEVAVVEDEDIPVIRLDKLFGIKKREGLFKSDEDIEAAGFKLKAELMVITKDKEGASMYGFHGSSSSVSNAGSRRGHSGGIGRVGLIIDELISKQDIVVKPFRGLLKQSRGFAGATLLGDGSPALIIDVATLI
jgi:two-component system, chemotaxis family, sensor kinase CheA